MLSSANLNPPHLNPVQAYQEGAAIGRWCQHYVADDTAGRLAGLGPVVEMLPITSCKFCASLFAHRSVSTPLFMIGGDTGSSCFHLATFQVHERIFCPFNSALIGLHQRFPTFLTRGALFRINFYGGAP